MSALVLVCGRVFDGLSDVVGLRQRIAEIEWAVGRTFM